MKANELRLGNLIYDIPERGGKIISVNKVWIDDDGECLYFDLCNPIPLTEEWLVKFGFEYINDYWLHDEFDFDIVMHGHGYVFADISEDSGRYFAHGKFQYVHQLQNLYFALTGKELTINPDLL